MFLFFTNLWAHLQIFLKKAFIAYYLSKEKMEPNLLSLTPTFQKHIHTVSYYEKGKRMIASWQQMRFVLESSVMVVLMESEFTLFFLILGACFFAPNSINPKFCELLIGYKSHYKV